MSRNDIVDKGTTHKQFKEGKWYKCIDPCDDLIKDHWYECMGRVSDGVSDGVFTEGGWYYTRRFDPLSESDCNPDDVKGQKLSAEDTTCLNVWKGKPIKVTINRDDYLDCARYCADTVIKTTLDSFLTTKEETNMSIQRKSVKVELFDNDKGLPVEHSLVGAWENYVTEDTDQITVQEIISTGDVVTLLEQHNDIRVGLIDEEILTRTGNSVKLRPVKLKHLTWLVDGRKVN